MFEWLKAILTAIIPLIFAAITGLFPDFPLNIDVFTALLLWILVQVFNRFVFRKEINTYHEIIKSHR